MRAGGAGVLMMEDDVILAESAPAWVQAARARGCILVGWMAAAECYGPLYEMLAAYRGRLLHRRPWPYRALGPLFRPEEFWGAQCIYLPDWAVREVLACPVLAGKAEDGVAWDIYLRHYFTARQNHVRVAWPNFAEHLSPEGLVRRRSIRRSFFPDPELYQEVIHGSNL